MEIIVDTKNKTIIINIKNIKQFNGGNDSGNFGHEGRPGKVGGSGNGEEHKINKKTLAKSSKKSKLKSSYRIVNLPEKEFARVQHAFISDVNNDQRRTGRLRKAIGNYVYTGILREDGTRDIIKKEVIK